MWFGARARTAAPASTPAALAAAIAAALIGCAAPPVEAPPRPPEAAAAFKEQGLWQRASGATADPVPDAWWQLFADPVLDDLERRLVIGNENLRFAVAQVAAAQAQLAASRAPLLPQLNADLGATRSRGPTSSAAPDTSRGASNSLALSAAASWEVDLWGRLGQGVNAARSSFEASRADLAAARLSAQATLAQTYLALRTAEAQQQLAERSAEAFKRSLDLTQLRYEAGVAARSDVLQAETQWKSAQAQALDAEAQRAQSEHAIAVLLGELPARFALARTARLPEAPAVPVLLPATLLERRPDIGAAQQRVAAAYARLGVARAAFFPALTLSASAGTRGSTLADLFSAPHLFWSIGPALAQTLFDNGALQAASDEARAAAEQATATYRQAVLVALQEVEDNLVLADRLHAQGELQQQALAAARRNLEIVLEQYRAGTVSFLEVATGQNAVLGAERSTLDLRNRELAAVNQLLKNLAGRW